MIRLPTRQIVHKHLKIPNVVRNLTTNSEKIVLITHMIHIRIKNFSKTSMYLAFNITVSKIYI